MNIKRLGWYDGVEIIIQETETGIMKVDRLRRPTLMRFELAQVSMSTLYGHTQLLHKKNAGNCPRSSFLRQNISDVEKKSSVINCCTCPWQNKNESAKKLQAPVESINLG